MEKLENFLQAPKILFDRDNQYFVLSNNAKLMYMIMLDRYKLSIQSTKQGNNVWFDKNSKRSFIKFSNPELANILNLKSNNTVIKLKKELENLGLIKQFIRPNNTVDCYFFVYLPTLATDYKEENKKDVDDIPNIKVQLKNNINDNKKDIEDVKEDNSIPAELVIKEFFNENNNENKVSYPIPIETAIMRINNPNNSLENKWQVKKGCSICKRLVNVLNKSPDKELISAKEFWYLRNIVQKYEQDNIIGDFSKFINALRKQYKRNEDSIDIKIGEKTNIDISEDLLRSYKKRRTV